MRLIATLKKILIHADFKSVQKKFTDQGISKETIKQYLEDFKKLRDSRDLGENKDIDKWGKKPWDEFKEFVDKTKKEKTKTQEKKLQKLEGAELVFENDNWFIYKILTYEAAVRYGSGTKWCITQFDHWRHYISQGNCFYFIISKVQDASWNYYKIAVKVSKRESFEYWNAADVKFKPFSDLKELKKYFTWFQVELPTVEIDWSKPIKETNEERLYRSCDFELSGVDGSIFIEYSFGNISSCGDKRLLIACEIDGVDYALLERHFYEDKKLRNYFLAYCLELKNAEKNIEIDLLELTGFKLNQKNLTKKNAENVLNFLLGANSEKEQIEAVKRDGHALQYMINPSEAVQLQAIATNPNSIQWIENPSEAVKKAAAKQGVNEKGLYSDALFRANQEKSKASIVEADFKTVQKKFTDQGIDEATVKQYVDEFKALRDKRDLGEHKDIDQWGKKPWDEFKEFVDKTKEEKSKSEEKKLQKLEGAELVFEDTNWFVYKILTHAAAMLYGSGTKWCITQPEGKHWRHYTRKGSCFYFLISKTKDKNDPFYKIAAQKQQNNNSIIYWDATDSSHSGEDFEANESLPNTDIFKWFKVERQKKDVDVEDLIERINDYVEQQEDYQTDPDQNESAVEYLLDNFEEMFGTRFGRRKSPEHDWETLEKEYFNHVDESILEKLKLLKKYCDENESLGSGWNFGDVLRDVCVVRTAGIGYVSNEIASIGLGQKEDELDEDFMDEIDALNEEELAQLERHTSYGNGRVYYGSDYDRFVLVVSEKLLSNALEEIEDQLE